MEVGDTVVEQLLEIEQLMVGGDGDAEHEGVKEAVDEKEEVVVREGDTLPVVLQVSVPRRDAVEVQVWDGVKDDSVATRGPRTACSNAYCYPPKMQNAIIQTLEVSPV